MSPKLEYHAAGVREAGSDKIGSHSFAMENNIISNDYIKAMSKEFLNSSAQSQSSNLLVFLGDN